MLPVLNDVEMRILGCLIEKSVITPDLYPLTLNALRNACNQKSSRDPVMNLAPGEVQHAVRELQARHLVRVDDNFRSGVEKYTQRLCNTRYSELQFDPAELAIVCLLLLRGAQTPGELRARSGRLYDFPDNEAVTAALRGLSEREGGAIVARLPRRAGRRDSEYVQLFAGPVESAPEPSADATRPEEQSSRPAAARPGLEARVAALEAEVARLRAQLDTRDAEPG